jgi:hypothetical protein
MTIGSYFTVGNCISNLPVKFGGRADLFSFADPQVWPVAASSPGVSRSVVAVMESIRELTETYEFEELKYQTLVPPNTPLSMTAGNPVIPISTLLGTISSNSTNYPQFQGQNIIDVTDFYDSWMWFVGSTGTSTSVNQAGRIIKYRRIPTIDTYSYGITNQNQGQLGVAPPVYFSRFGNVIQVGPVPDQNYNYFVRMKLRHPFPIGGTTAFLPAVITASVNGGIVNGLSLVSGGAGYTPNLQIPLYFTNSPTNNPATGIALANSSGVITTYTTTATGGGYVSAPTVYTAAVSQQQVFMPESWQEIVELCACQRLALWEGASEYITMFEQLLQTKGIDIPKARARKAQMERDEMHNERSMSLMVGNYTWAN